MKIAGSGSASGSRSATLAAINEKCNHEVSFVDLCPFGKVPYPRIRTTDPAPFVRGLQEANKNIFFSKFFAYYFLNVHLLNFLKIKSHNVVTKQYKSRIFVLFLLDDGRIRIQIRIREVQKYKGPTDPDPDPQHCMKVVFFLTLFALFLLQKNW